jgi:hypothetical protein
VGRLRVRELELEPGAAPAGETPLGPPD